MPEYSAQLFNTLFNKIQIELNSLCNSSNISFKGLWAFAYLRGANALKSVYFNHVELNSLNSQHSELINKLQNSRLDCDYGSLGFSFSKMRDNDSFRVDFLAETYKDAKGTVCYSDTIIGQQHACFVIIRNEQEIFGALDFFFEGDCKKECQDKIVNFFKAIFEPGEVFLPYLSDYINTFKIRQFEDFLFLQRDDSENEAIVQALSHKLNLVTKSIEELIAVSSLTPLMGVIYKNRTPVPELISLNFDFIHSIIQHEQRFCPLTSEKNCFYFKEFNSFNNHSLKCDNQFLKKYYYDVFDSLGAIMVTKSLSVGQFNYTLEIVCKSGKDCNEVFANISSTLLEEIDIKAKKLSSTIAVDKYRDERVYLLLNHLLKRDNEIYAFSLSRKVKSHLRFSKCGVVAENDCNNRNQYITEKAHKKIKQFISPSILLPIQYTEEKSDFWGILEKYDKERSNVVHFNITNEMLFVSELKKLISRNFGKYLDTLEPYLDSKKVSTQGKLTELSLSYVGKDPFVDNKFAEVIKGKLNLIEALLQEEEIRLLARKSAISQVFARNLSHNHGSHVLSRMIHRDQIDAIQSAHEEIRKILSKKLKQFGQL